MLVADWNAVKAWAHTSNHLDCAGGWCRCSEEEVSCRSRGGKTRVPEAEAEILLLLQMDEGAHHGALRPAAWACHGQAADNGCWRAGPLLAA